MKKFLKWFLIILVSLTILLISTVMIIPKVAPQFGASAKGEHFKRIEASSNYRNGKFYNLVKTTMNGEDGSMMDAFWKFIKGGDNREPKDTISTYPFEKDKFTSSSEGVSFTWFGHSTAVIRIEGKNLLIDPVFSNHASPFSFLGPKGFPYTHQYTLDDLPEIDAVLISHDHYDHLDYETFLKLKNKVKKFYVPLGVSAHLIRWGIPAEHIIEMDWWDENQFDDKLKFACVPMRHFSGRGLGDRNSTLWAGWVILSPDYKVIHTGDSGYGNHFSAIGKKYGPFDLAMVECGQYNENWPNIHMFPEQTVKASIDLNSKYLLPIHWGRFNLALHAWTDPAERITAEAKNKNVNVITPKVGEIVLLSPPLPKTHWWD